MLHSELEHYALIISYIFWLCYKRLIQKLVS